MPYGPANEIGSDESGTLVTTISCMRYHPAMRLATFGIRRFRRAWKRGSPPIATSDDPCFLALSFILPSEQFVAFLNDAPTMPPGLRSVCLGFKDHSWAVIASLTATKKRPEGCSMPLVERLLRVLDTVASSIFFHGRASAIIEKILFVRKDAS